MSDAPEWLNVSRETLADLQSFRDLVLKWNPAINLISKKSVDDIWERHILDSAQVFDYFPDSPQLWCDLGSGGGFPGIVVAILAKEIRPGMSVTLVESDRRKGTFLREAIRALDLNATVEITRIEDLTPQNADVVSARALASVADLLPHIFRHLTTTGNAILLKGAGASDELAKARQDWSFDDSSHTSRTSLDGQILILKDITHAQRS